MRMFQKSISSLISENFVYARALDGLGIDFTIHKEDKLADLVKQMGMEQRTVVRSLYLSESRYRPTFTELEAYPLQFLVRYLRYSHTSYIKEYLPFVYRLLQKVDQANEDIGDLKAVFPLFVEDFINHIYEEEDELFHYIVLLDKVNKSGSQEDIENLIPHLGISLQEILEEHAEEDEMKNFRELIEKIIPTSLEMDVVLAEIKSFDRELHFHAEIENQILLPRAIKLESKIWNEIPLIDSRKNS
jgi:regulator of cell morphogenesis and NO signaling